MPIKPVEPHPELVKGKVFHRVHIPKILTDGKRKRKFFKSQKRAVEFATQVEQARNQHLNGYDLLPVQDRAQVGRLISKVGGVDALGRAVDFYLSHNPTRTLKIPELVQEFLQDRKRAGLSRTYMSPLESTVRKFSRAFHDRPAHLISTEEIKEWLYAETNARTGETLDPETRKGYLTRITTMFSFGMDHKLVSFNPAAEIAAPKVSRKPIKILTPRDALRLMRAIEIRDPGLIASVVLVLFGGMRQAEALRVRPEHFKSGAIDLPASASKNNKRRLVEIDKLPTLKAWLDVQGSEFPPINLRNRLDAIHAATGELYPSPIDWPSNALRKSFISYSVPFHGVKSASLLADNSEDVVERNYRKLVSTSDAEEFWKIVPFR